MLCDGGHCAQLIEDSYRCTGELMTYTLESIDIARMTWQDTFCFHTDNRMM